MLQIWLDGFIPMPYNQYTKKSIKKFFNNEHYITISINFGEICVDLDQYIDLSK